MFRKFSLKFRQLLLKQIIVKFKKMKIYTESLLKKAQYMYVKLAVI